MHKKLYYVVFLSCFYLLSNAQINNVPSVANTTNSIIKGLVVDSLGNDTIVSAIVAIFNKNDSTLLKAQSTNQKGEFIFNDIAPSSYYIQIQHLGYVTLVINIPKGHFSSKEINLGTLKMHFSSVELGEVVVTAQIPEFIIKKDTIEYNAAAFRTPEGAVVEDLLKLLPGVEVDPEGGIKTIAGKNITRVFVNDKEFFGDDPKVATKNLPANIVDKVQMIEKKSDLAILTGVEDDNPETIINIKVKRGLFGGWMGNISAGVGALVDNPTGEDARYALQTTLNRFDEKNQTSVIANANNINQQAYTIVGNNSILATGGGNGITSSNMFGINSSNKIKDNLQIGGNTSYNYTDRYTNNKSFSQNFLRSVGSSEIDSTFYSQRSSTSRSYSSGYSFSGIVNFKDSLTTVNFRPTISYNSSISRNYSGQNTMGGDVDSSMINQSNSNDLSNSNRLSLQMQLDVSRKLSNRGRRVTLSGSLNKNRGQGDGTKESTSEFSSNAVENEYIDQISTSKTNTYSYNITATYVEPIGKSSLLNFSYNLQLNNSESINNALNYDNLTGDYTKRNAKFSRTSESMTSGQNIRVNFNSTKKKYSYNIGLNVAPNYTRSKIFVDDWYGTDIDSVISNVDGRRVINIAPSLNFTYRMGDMAIQKNLQFQYNGSTRHPNSDQLSASNNMNPLNTILGNPDLTPSFSNNLSLMYTHNNRNTQKALTLNGSFSFTINDIINYITYHDGGTMTTTYINQDGNWNARGSLMFLTPLDGNKKLRLNTTSSYSYQNTIGYSRVSSRDENNKTVLSSEKNIAKTSNLSESLSLSYTNKWYQGQIHANISYNSRNYTLSSMNSVNTYNYGVSYNTQITFPFKVSLSSNISYSANRGLSSGYNKNNTMWNAQVSRSLFSGKGDIRLQMNDILKQRFSISHSESANSIQDSESTVLTSYYLLTFTYRFNKITGGAVNKPSPR